MAEYFECTVRYERTTEKGSQQKVTEAYLVDAISFGEAEKRIIEEMTPFTSGDLFVVSIKRYNVQEIVIDECGFVSESDAEYQKITGDNVHASGDADKWYRVKINLITIDEKTAKEKKAPMYLLVNAGSVRAAHQLTETHMRGTIFDYSVENVVETKLMDVFFYDTEMLKKMGGRTITKELLSKKDVQKAVRNLRNVVPDGCKMTVKAGDKEAVVADKTHDGHNENDQG